MSSQMRPATMPGNQPGDTIQTLIEVYVCDSCDTFSPDAAWWVRVDRLGSMTSWGDPLAVDRHFCSLAHAAEWLGRDRGKT